MNIRQSKAVQTGLDVTPLIDVVFILLVFFMLATNFTNYRLIRVETPRETQVVETSEGAIVIFLHADGSVTFDNRPIEAADLPSEVADVVAIDAGRTFLVRPGPDVRLQDAIGIYDVAKAAGAQFVSFSNPPKHAAG